MLHICFYVAGSTHNFPPPPLIKTASLLHSLPVTFDLCVRTAVGHQINREEEEQNCCSVSAIFMRINTRQQQSWTHTHTLKGPFLPLPALYLETSAPVSLSALSKQPMNAGLWPQRKGGGVCVCVCLGCIGFTQPVHCLFSLLDDVIIVFTAGLLVTENAAFLYPMCCLINFWWNRVKGGWGLIIFWLID